jgi:hypothetical protein
MSNAKKDDALSQTSPETTERRSDERRDENDRRAFWRPTPDRRREQTERGRRSGDAS